MKPSTLFVLGTCSSPVVLAMAAGFPGRSDDLVIPDLPPLVAAAPSSVSTIWVKTLERVSVMDLAEQVEMEPMRLAQLNGLSALDNFEAQQWVALPNSIESSLFLVASSVEDDDGLTRPGANRVRLWRDRPPEGAFPRSSNAKAAKALCAAGLQNYKIQGGQQSPLFMAMGKSPNTSTRFRPNFYALCSAALSLTFWTL